MPGAAFLFESETMPNTGSANTDLVALLGGTGGFNDDVTTIQGIANRTLTTSVTATGTPANTNETDLWMYSLPANSLNANGRGVRVRVWGTTASNAANKTLKLYFGSAVVRTFGPTALNGDDWWLEMIVFRTGASAQEAVGYSGNGVTAMSAPARSAPTQDLTAAVTIKMTGTSAGGTANDIVLRAAFVETLY